MIPLAIEISDFRSFRGTQRFTFPALAGLYFMQGANESEPRLEANGAGKSTVWEALTWCWYGKTSRGLKAGDVCNWDAGKGARVSFTFLRADGAPCKMTRTWSPNTWTLEDPEEIDAPLDLVKEKDNPALAWLGLAFEPWLHCIFSAQDAPMFLDLKRDAQAALFSEVMGLDKWLEYSARASKKASDQDRTCRNLERDLANAHGMMDALGRQDFSSSVEDFERKRRQRISSLEEQHASAMAERKTTKREMERFTELETLAREHEDQCLADLQHSRKPARGDKTCPTCGQRVHTPAEITDDQNRYDKARAELASAQRAAADARRAFEMIERVLDDIERDAMRAAKEANPYTDMEERKRKDVADLRGLIEDTQAQLDASTERLELLQFWVRGFKEVRLSLIAEALTELEIEVNSCCDALGLVGWALEFRVDRETKSGSIQRGFDVFVRSPHNAAPVPWEAWSGGESQRLRLAATMGLADLVRSRTGTQLALEVWDEPTNGLSPQGTRDLLECLHERAQREQRQVWVVDHHSHEFGGFAGGAVITKTAQGSRISTH